MSEELSPHDRQELKVSLRHYFEALFREHEKAHGQLAENVRVALAAQDKRLDGMNEFRNSLEDVTRKSITRDYYEAQHESLEARVATLNGALDTRINQLEAFRSKAIGVGAVLTVISGVIGAAIFKILTR